MHVGLGESRRASVLGGMQWQAYRWHRFFGWMAAFISEAAPGLRECWLWSFRDTAKSGRGWHKEQAYRLLAWISAASCRNAVVPPWCGVASRRTGTSVFSVLFRNASAKSWNFFFFNSFEIFRISAGVSSYFLICLAQASSPCSCFSSN